MNAPDFSMPMLMAALLASRSRKRFGIGEPPNTKAENEAAYKIASAALNRAEDYAEAHPHIDFRTAVRRVLGTAEWRSDEGRMSAAEAKRQRKQKRNLQNRRP